MNLKKCAFYVSRLLVAAVLMFALSAAWGQSTNTTKATKTATPTKATKSATPAEATKAAPAATSTKARKTDDEIRQEMIAQSLASYRGSCPCPYNVDRAGRQCGRRSAYSRPGGASPLCYARDVTQKMVDDYRNQTKQ